MIAAAHQLSGCIAVLTCASHEQPTHVSVRVSYIDKTRRTKQNMMYKCSSQHLESEFCIHQSIESLLECSCTIV